MQDQASLPSSAWSDGVFFRGGEDSVVAASKREVIRKDPCQAVHGPMVYFSEVVKTALWQQQAATTPSVCSHDVVWHR